MSGSGAHRPFISGIYDAWVVTLPWADRDLRAMLPSGLELAPQTLTSAGTHPLVFLFGHHRDVRVPVLIGSHQYLELVVSIPWVRRKSSCGDPGPFVFMPRLYLSSWLFVILGWFYAYDKRRARNTRTECSYDVRSLLRRVPLISGEFEPAGLGGPPNKFPHFPPFAPVFQQPLVGKLCWTPYLCSVLAFDLEQASIQPVASRVRIARPFLPGLIPGEHVQGGIDQSPLGSFRLSIPWTLSLPTLCGWFEPPSKPETERSPG